MRHTKFIILEYIDSHAYKFNISPKINNVFHIWLLQSAVDNPFPSQCCIDWQPSALIINDNEEEYEIEAILNKHVVNCGQGHCHKY